ncbi:hypothetical protein LINPERPRIM_LOCUS14558 [Linum perenne]
MTMVWRSGRRMDIEEFEGKLILFRFNHLFDLRRVMESGALEH